MVSASDVTSDYAESLVADGHLVGVLQDWSPPFAGYHLYYPSRRQLSPAFALVVDALRFRETLDGRHDARR